MVSHNASFAGLYSRHHHMTNIVSSLNRYSMPVTKSRNGIRDMLALDQTNTTRFLFGDEEASTSTDPKSYLQMHATDDNFPILVRGEHPQKVNIHIILDSSRSMLTALCSCPLHLQHWISLLVNHQVPNLLAGPRLHVTALASKAFQQII